MNSEELKLAATQNDLGDTLCFLFSLGKDEIFSLKDTLHDISYYTLNLKLFKKIAKLRNNKYYFTFDEFFRTYKLRIGNVYSYVESDFKLHNNRQLAEAYLEIIIRRTKKLNFRLVNIIESANLLDVFVYQNTKKLSYLCSYIKPATSSQVEELIVGKRQFLEILILLPEDEYLHLREQIHQYMNKEERIGTKMMSPSYYPRYFFKRLIAQKMI